MAGNPQEQKAEPYITTVRAWHTNWVCSIMFVASVADSSGFVASSRGPSSYVRRECGRFLWVCSIMSNLVGGICLT